MVMIGYLKSGNYDMKYFIVQNVGKGEDLQ